MKYALFLIASVGLLLPACASQKSNRIPTFKEAVDNNPDLESGVYNKSNGENVDVQVMSMRAKIEEAEHKAYEAQREADYAKHSAEQVQYENLLLRARGNYKLEKQVNELQGFDRGGNPIIKQQTVNPEPIANPEPQALVQPEPMKQNPLAQVMPSKIMPTLHAPKVEAPEPPAQSVPEQHALAQPETRAPASVTPETKPVSTPAASQDAGKGLAQPSQAEVPKPLQTTQGAPAKAPLGPTETELPKPMVN